MSEHHIGLSFGRVEHWHDGLGEFSRQLGTELALRAESLRRHHGIHLHYHLPRRWHGQFGRDVHYLPLHTLQRFWHPRLRRFWLKAAAAALSSAARTASSAFWIPPTALKPGPTT